jgi:hypothetical protein
VTEPRVGSVRERGPQLVAEATIQPQAWCETPIGSLLGRDRLTGTHRDVPQVAVWVGEAAAVAAPLLAGGLDDRTAGGLGMGQDLVDPVVRGHDVGQEDAAEAATFR